MSRSPYETIMPSGLRLLPTVRCCITVGSSYKRAGVFDYEIRAAKPENGPSEPIGKVSGSRVPGGTAINFQPYSLW